MSSVNSIFILGRLGQDPEYREFENGGGMATFSVATSKKWKNKDGESQEKTSWHNIKAFGKTGEICSKYLKKGSQVFIQGEIQYEQYEKDGETKYFTSIVPHSVQFLGGTNTTAGDDDEVEIMPAAAKTSEVKNYAPQSAAEIDGF